MAPIAIGGAVILIMVIALSRKGAATPAKEERTPPGLPEVPESEEPGVPSVAPPGIPPEMLPDETLEDIQSLVQGAVDAGNHDCYQLLASKYDLTPPPGT